MTPTRIQRQRSKGWRMPENTVYVGRGSKWGNPYAVGKAAPEQVVAVVRKGRLHLLPGEPTRVRDRADAVGRFSWLVFEPMLNRPDHPAYPTRAEIKAELAGKNLACWCPLTDAQGNHVPCHADVLLELANGGAER